MALYNLTENCNYGDLKDELIRNLLVVSIYDIVLLDKLQLDPKLIFETVKTVIRRKEAVHEQHQALSGAKTQRVLSSASMRSVTSN